MICKNLQTSRHWPLPSFFVIDPGDPYKVDQIPPSRITDFKVTAHLPKEPYGPARLEFTWTAPGDDFSIGRAVKYKFYCGYFPNSLDYDSCKSISTTTKFARVPGTSEYFEETDFRDFDKEVFFAIRTSDERNESEESNIVSVFLKSMTTSKFVYIYFVTVTRVSISYARRERSRIFTQKMR